MLISNYLQIVYNISDCRRSIRKYKIGGVYLRLLMAECESKLQLTFLTLHSWFIRFRTRRKKCK